MVKKTKQINFTLLYGVVYKKTSKALYINYGLGKIKVLLNEVEDWKTIQKGYTISVSGFIQKSGIRTCLVAQQVNIFDKVPHYINLEG